MPEETYSFDQKSNELRKGGVVVGMTVFGDN